MLICLVEGKVAGNCQITWSKKIKTRYRANVAIALLSEFWNQGIGTRLFQELIHIAENNINILQIELEFVEGNTRARALYEKMGFKITGVKPNAIRLKDGTLLNEYSINFCLLKVICKVVYNKSFLSYSQNTTIK